MKTLNKLMQEVIALTTEIETKYPELYKNLEETPITIHGADEHSVRLDDLKNYVETLRSQLQHHIETHKKPTG